MKNHKKTMKNPNKKKLKKQGEQIWKHLVEQISILIIPLKIMKIKLTDKTRNKMEVKQMPKEQQTDRKEVEIQSIHYQLNF